MIIVSKLVGIFSIGRIGSKEGGRQICVIRSFSRIAISPSVVLISSSFSIRISAPANSAMPISEIDMPAAFQEFLLGRLAEFSA